MLVIHFNGWPQPIEEIRSLCREHGAALIEDCALAFLSARDGAPLGSFGDASVFCLYKTLPLPHGAALAMGSGGAERLAIIPLRNPGALSTAARTADLAIARIRSRAGAVGGALARVKSWVGRALTAAKVERSPVGSMTFDERQLDLGMSPWAERLLPRFDYEEVRERRRANFERLLGALRDRSTPLFTGRAEASAGTGVSASTTSRGDYYAGIEDRSVDTTATGAIADSGAKALGQADENKQ